MINFNYAVMAQATDIKSQAKNIHNIANWFRESELASNLNSSQSLELVSKMHGYKTYASYQADKSADFNKLIPFEQFFKADNLSNADQLFLRVAYTYLNTPQNKDFEFYKEPSVLLLYAIDHFCTLVSKNELHNINFLQLAFINHLGLRVTPYTNEISEQDLLFYRHERTGDKLEEADKLGLLLVLTFLSKESNGLFCYHDGKWDLVSNVVGKENSKYSLSKKITPTISNSALKKVLNAQEICSTKIYDLCTTRLDIFEANLRTKSRYSLINFTGINFNIIQDQNNVRSLVSMTNFYSNITYIDHNGSKKEFSFSTDLAFGIKLNEKFSIDLSHSNYVNPNNVQLLGDELRMAKDITQAYSNNLKVLFQNNQSTLFTVWSHFFHLATSELPMKSKIMELLRVSKEYGSVYLTPDLVLLSLGRKEDLPQRRQKNKPHHFRLIDKNGTVIQDNIFTHTHLLTVLRNMKIKISKDWHIEKLNWL